MHWTEGSGKVLSAVVTLNGVAKKKKIAWFTCFINISKLR